MNWYEEILAYLAEPEPPTPGAAEAGWARVSESIAADALRKRGRPVNPKAIATEITRWPTGEQQAEAAQSNPPARLTAEEAAEVARLDRLVRDETPEPYGAPEPPRGVGDDAYVHTLMPVRQAARIVSEWSVDARRVLEEVMNLVHVHRRLPAPRDRVVDVVPGQPAHLQPTEDGRPRSAQQLSCLLDRLQVRGNLSGHDQKRTQARRQHGPEHTTSRVTR